MPWPFADTLAPAGHAHGRGRLPAPGAGKAPLQGAPVLTDNGVQFAWQPHQWFPGGHSFARICRAFGVEHRLTNPAHPWTNGPAERLNRPIKEATVQRYHYQTTDELNEHLQAFLLVYNHAKRLKTLRGLTPHQFVCAQWQKTPLSLPKTRPTSRWDYATDHLSVNRGVLPVHRPA
nr:integrase core domain-containing protein [Hymenobacter sp. BRD67]